MKRLMLEAAKRITRNFAAPQEVVSQIVQRQLFFMYRGSIFSGGATIGFRDAGYRVFSQSDEDGLLLYIFSLIGIQTRLLVDMACGRPLGSNATNLILNWGFHALLVEGDPENIRLTEEFYREHPDTKLFPPRIIKEWITAENINDILEGNGFQGEIDLLSLDVDGVDYWLWDNLSVVSPRVVVVEYQDCFEANEAVTIPYSADFSRHDHHPDYFGASLAAFVKLAHRKKYRLVGCNHYGYNAFFVREDVAVPALPAINPETCLVHPKIVANRVQKRDVLSRFYWQSV
jgi:hypothetical protein